MSGPIRYRLYFPTTSMIVKVLMASHDEIENFEVYAAAPPPSYWSAQYGEEPPLIHVPVSCWAPWPSNTTRPFLAIWVKGKIGRENVALEPTKTQPMSERLVFDALVFRPS